MGADLAESDGLTQALVTKVGISLPSEQAMESVGVMLRVIDSAD